MQVRAASGAIRGTLVRVAAIAVLAGCGASSSSASGGTPSPSPTEVASPTARLSLTGHGQSARPLAGHWTVATGSVAGYRVTENFLGSSSEAVARTSALTGQADISRDSVNGLQLIADLTQCKGVDNHVSYAGFTRDNIVKGRILNMAQFPNATLVVNSLALPSGASSGKPLKISAQGMFTLKGKTNPVTLALNGQSEGDQKLEVAGAFTITLSDYDIHVPTVPFTSAGSTGIVEVDVFLQKA